MSAEDVDAINDRRAYLIDKDLDVGLTFNELIELDCLDLAINRYVDRCHPVPIEDLRWLRERVSVLAAVAEEFAVERRVV